VRASTVAQKASGGTLGILGKAGGKGGFSKSVEESAKKKADYAKNTFGQTEYEKAEAKKYATQYEADKVVEERKIKADRSKLAENNLTVAKIGGDEERIKAAEKFKREVDYKNKKNIFEEKEYSDEFNKGIREQYESMAKAGERRQEAYAKTQESRLAKLREGVKSAGTTGVVGAALGAALAGPIGAGVLGAAGAAIGAKTTGQENKARASKIRDNIKKDPKKQAKDALKALSGDEDEEEKPKAGGEGGGAPTTGGPATGGTPT
jgi:hypothetical protein